MAARAVTGLNKLMAFGRTFGVDGEEDFKAAAQTYAEEAKLIAQMRDKLKEDGMTIEKEYVKGRANICIHPLVQEIPKHIEVANRTLKIIGDIIKDRGQKKTGAGDDLDNFRL